MFEKLEVTNTWIYIISTLMRYANQRHQIFQKAVEKTKYK